MLIPKEIRNLDKKVIEKLREILENVYHAKIVPKKADKNSNSSSLIVSKKAVSKRVVLFEGVRKCPKCGGDMYYDLVTSQPSYRVIGTLSFFDYTSLDGKRALLKILEL